MYTMALHRIICKGLPSGCINFMFGTASKSLLTGHRLSSNTITPSHLIYLVELLLEVIVDVVKLALDCEEEVYVKEPYLES
jgi:hypothetical protein